MTSTPQTLPETGHTRQDARQPQTTLPWRVWHGDKHKTNEVFRDGRTVVADLASGGAAAVCHTDYYTPEIAKANAAFIVLACNSHERLTEENERLRKALEFYARGGNCAETIEDAARGDIDLSDVSIALTEDCGDIARSALTPTGNPS